MTKTALLLLGLGTLFVAAPARAQVTHRPPVVHVPAVQAQYDACANENDPLPEWCMPARTVAPAAAVAVAEDDAGIVLEEDDVADLDSTYSAEERATATAMRAWMQSLASGLLALVTVALCAIGLARMGQLRRPLAMTVLARHPVPAVVILSLLSPIVPPLVLIHAERDFLPSPVLLVAAACAAMALSMLLARRRLAGRVRGAVSGRLGGVEDGALVVAEVTPHKLVAPPGARGRVPWFVADLTVTADGEAARVALAQSDVDLRAARMLSRLASGQAQAGQTLTVLGAATRVPADAGAVDPLCREAPMQARLGRGLGGRALLVAGSPPALLRQLQLECVLLGLLFTVATTAAGLAFFH